MRRYQATPRRSHPTPRDRQPPAATATRQARCSRCATAAACVRPCTPSLARIRETWTLAVFSAMYRAAPIWRLVAPSASSARTCRSRGVRPKGSASASSARPPPLPLAARRRPPTSDAEVQPGALAQRAHLARPATPNRAPPRPPARRRPPRRAGTVVGADERLGLAPARDRRRVGALELIPGDRGPAPLLAAAAPARPGQLGLALGQPALLHGPAVLGGGGEAIGVQPGPGQRVAAGRRARAGRARAARGRPRRTRPMQLTRAIPITSSVQTSSRSSACCTAAWAPARSRRRTSRSAAQRAVEADPLRLGWSRRPVAGPRPGSRRPRPRRRRRARPRRRCSLRKMKSRPAARVGERRQRLLGGVASRPRANAISRHRERDPCVAAHMMAWG